MKVLIACEFSGIVREEFRKLGHDAWSCDLLPTEIPGQHIQDDVLKHLNEKWDLMIVHPPCTFLSISGNRWFKPEYRNKYPTREKDREEAINFIKTLLSASIDKIALENPVGIISTRIRKPDQIIQPYMFGDSYSKKTCLWLKNLPKLIPTKIVDKGEFIILKGGRKIPKWYADFSVWKMSKEEIMKHRSRTFTGIAKAMAEQWGEKK